jgi:hypothetical protein
VVMPAHHMHEYLLIKKATRQTEMHPQGQPERGAT